MTSDKVFKYLLNDQANRTSFYCNTAQHVVIINPQNAYAHEEYGVRLEACNCTQEQKDYRAAADAKPDEPPATPEEFHALGNDDDAPSRKSPKGMRTTQ